ncbi:MAG: hypothetical protein M1416_00720 [Candidatus Pacearchaeota archaeon]|nr:hypothetical protein [Candidatus Pacearchaeota archaeon]
MTKKRGKFIQINLSNRGLYTFIILGILTILGVSVYAYGTNAPQTFGHSIGEMAPPTGCDSGQFLKLDGANWICSEIGITKASGIYQVRDTCSNPNTITFSPTCQTVQCGNCGSTVYYYKCVNAWGSPITYGVSCNCISGGLNGATSPQTCDNTLKGYLVN